MKRWIAWLAVFLALFQVSLVQADDVLAQQVVDIDGGVSGTHNNVAFWFFTIPENQIIFDEFILDTNSEGLVLTVNAANEADFGAITDIITNGQPNDLTFNMHTEIGGGGYSLPESLFFASSPYQFNGVDLHGSTVDSISLRVDRLDLTPFPVGETRFQFTGTLIFRGTPVPEPASCLLVGAIPLPLVARAAYKRRRCRRHSPTLSASPCLGGSISPSASRAHCFPRFASSQRPP